MSKLLDDIVELEKTWDREYCNYCSEAEKIDCQIATISGKILTYISTINALKRELEINVEKINTFLSKLGNVGPVPDYKVFKPEYKAEYIQSPIKTDCNPREYMNDDIPEKAFDKFKTGIKNSLEIGILGPAANKYSRQRLKEAIVKAENAIGLERLSWQNDLGKRKGVLSRYKTELQITELYHSVFSAVRDTINHVIIPEIPGITAFLYAQGVKDATLSGKLPSQAKPVSIKRFLKSSAYLRHVNFVKNTHAFYVLFVNYYENDYLSEIINNKEKIVQDIETFEDKKNQLKTNAVFGGKTNV